MTTPVIPTTPMPAFQEISLTELHESKHNPRHHFDALGLSELRDSILEVGVLTPLLVRPNAKGYEIAAGHRRYRAAKHAGLETVPCLIRKLSDAQFMEILTIENLQREDVHPLDEAAGYEALMAAPYTMTVETLAAKVGKSIKYIYDRVKLLALKEPARGMFWEGVITAGHAILLARLTPSQQKAAVGTAEQTFEDGGLLIPERALYTETEEDEADRDRKRHPYQFHKAVSVRELEGWINRHVRLDPARIEPVLFPETAPIIQAATQEKDTLIPITHEYHVMPYAKDADGQRTYGPLSWKRADGNEGSKTCPFAELGVIVVGAGRGEAFNVCIDKKDCLIHWKAEVQAAAARAKSGPASAKATQAEDKAKKVREQEAAARERDEARQAQWKKMTPKIQAAVTARIPKLNATASGVLADQILSSLKRIGYDTKTLGVPRGKTAEDFVRYLGSLCLERELSSWRSHEHFPPIARALGVDLSPFVQTAARKGPKGKG